MNDRLQPTQFDCLRLNAELVSDQPYDDVIFLLSFFTHLEEQCDAETDRLEELADSISRRTEMAEHSRAGRCMKGVDWPVAKLSLNTLERAEIATRYQVPYHVFGTGRASRGGKDLEYLQLEAIELKIQNYMAQMAELEAEIAAAMPLTPEGVILKLHFLSGLYKDGSSFAADVLAYVVDQSVRQLSGMLDISMADTAT